MDGPVAAAHRRGEPRPGRELTGRAEPGDVAGLGEQDQRGEHPHARQPGEDLDPRAGLRPPADLRIQPAGGLLQGARQRQRVAGDLTGDGGQLQGGQPCPARPA